MSNYYVWIMGWAMILDGMIRVITLGRIPSWVSRKTAMKLAKRG